MPKRFQFVARVRRYSVRLLREEHGASMVETALGLMLMMTMVLGVMEFSMMTYTYSVYADATRQGMRYASIHGSDSSSCSGPTTGCTDSTGANVVSTVTSYAADYVTAANSVNVSVSYPDSASTPGSRVTVTTTYTYKPLFGLGVTPSFTMTSAGRITF